MLNSYLNKKYSFKILQKCIKKNLTIVTCESFTGGNIAKYLSLHPGSSQFFKAGIIPYQTAAKKILLNINSTEIISKECCQELAKSAAINLSASYSIATTGVAGPSMEENKMPGTIFICIYNHDIDHFYDYNFVLPNHSRKRIVKFATTFALKELNLLIKN